LTLPFHAVSCSFNRVRLLLTKSRNLQLQDWLKRVRGIWGLALTSRQHRLTVMAGWFPDPIPSHPIQLLHPLHRAAPRSGSGAGRSYTNPQAGAQYLYCRSRTWETKPYGVHFKSNKERKTYQGERIDSASFQRRHKRLQPESVSFQSFPIVSVPSAEDVKIFFLFIHFLARPTVRTSISRSLLTSST
jgi:hypothetical protein